MRKILLSLLVLFFITLNSTYAETNLKNTITIKQEENKEITREDIFIFLGSYFFNSTPKSYEYIDLNFKNIPKNSKIERSLKTLVYHDLIKNSSTSLGLDEKMSAYNFYIFAGKVFNIELTLKKDILSIRNTEMKDLSQIKKLIGDKSLNILEINDSKKIKEKKNILNDVYKTLNKIHYDKENFNEIDILDAAIKGAAEGANDKYTVYFPPVNFKEFNEHLAGEYEGIGSYVNLEEPGVFKITSPIPGGPAEKAGLRGGDIVLKVDGVEITSKNGTKEIISWIKGPAGTTVTLTILRGNRELDIKVKREKIILKNLETEIKNRNTYSIKIKSFGENIAEDFETALLEIKDNNKINRIVIDLRNNGGGYLDQVVKMLDFVVKKGEKTAVVKYQSSTKDYKSLNEPILDLNNYKVVILQNSGTASASEIMIGTLNDYFEDIITIGEKSFGKGSVQSLKEYGDGSTLKITVAKWFTGKTETGIDGIGIEPDVELEYDIEKYQKYKTDNQFEKALNIR